ncbi:hypothetical protein [Verrucomicrobium spinosum]|uniref:hypothetical protein n=1 Tax=Verrucomicrobium spinosum TaxID=2736 RepID=UPI0009461E8C|nr:hypothetical protein [Verrucomicrobium spinosum]
MQVSITHLSTAGVLLEIGSLRIVTDPVLDTGMSATAPACRGCISPATGAPPSPRRNWARWTPSC